MEHILYDYFRSSAAYRVRIALNLKGIDVKHLPINLMPGQDEQHSAEYKKINPQGRVPYYCEADFKLGQSPAILEYLEERYPNPALLPSDPHEKARIRQLASIIACDVHPLNNLSVLKYLKQEFSADEEAVNKWYSHWIQAGFHAFESTLAEDNLYDTYCYKDEPTMADIYLIPQLYNARRFAVDLEAYPIIRQIESNCLANDNFRRAAPEAS